MTAGWSAASLTQGPPLLEVGTVSRASVRAAAPGALPVILPAAAGRTGFLRACAGAFSLPAWFGGNWDALEECLGDLDVPEGGLVVLWHGWRRRSRPATPSDCAIARTSSLRRCCGGGTTCRRCRRPCCPEPDWAVAVTGGSRRLPPGRSGLATASCRGSGPSAGASSG
jgi:hypothetical protein